LFQLPDDLGKHFIFAMPCDIDEEEILPGASFGGAAFDFGHVDREFFERLKGAVE